MLLLNAIAQIREKEHATDSNIRAGSKGGFGRGGKVVYDVDYLVVAGGGGGGAGAAAEQVAFEHPQILLL